MQCTLHCILIKFRLKGDFLEDLHWADKFAQVVIENNPDKKEYMVESGITPSGVVHIGNFREVMVQELVYRALLDKGTKATFQYIWDDFDRFRKVPKGVNPKWEQYIGMPVSKVPDPWGCHDSYAAHFKEKMESELEKISVRPKYLSATKLYEKCTFAENLKTGFEKTKEIREILDRFRHKPLEEDWVPAVAYCEKCGKDTTKVTYLGGYELEYACKCGHSNKIDFRKTGIVKFKWRVDWPSRWNYFEVDFESSGKDHKARGGSWDTGTIISEKIFDGKIPVGPMYEFINLKGQSEKMSSSKGNVVTVSDLLEVYEPEVVRFMYGARVNKAIDIPFDMDIFNKYNYFDEAETAYFEFKSGAVADKAMQKKKRLYELSQTNMIPEKLPRRLPFSEAVTLVQVVPNDFLVEKAAELLSAKQDNQLSAEETKLLNIRLITAKNWVESNAPEQVIIKVVESVSQETREEVKELKPLFTQIAENLDSCKTADEVQQLVFETAKSSDVKPRELFLACYSVLLEKPKGPKLGSFILAVGIDRVKKLFLSV